MQAEELVFTFRSTHAAIRGEQLLRDGGVAVRVMPLPDCLKAGCGICLRVDEGEFPRTAALLSGAGVAWEAVYRRTAAAGKSNWMRYGEEHGGAR